MSSYQLLPPMTSDERQQLRESIEQSGFDPRLPGRQENPERIQHGASEGQAPAPVVR